MLPDDRPLSPRGRIEIRRRRRDIVALIVAGATVVSACGTGSAALPGPTTVVTTIPLTTTVPVATTIEPPTTTEMSTTEPATASSAAPSTTSTTSSTVAAPTTSAAPVQPPASTSPVGPDLQTTTGSGLTPVRGITLAYLTAAFNDLAPRNLAVSVTVWRDHLQVFAQAAGTGAAGQPVTPDTPLVLASVSKLITAITVARLAQGGLIDLEAPVPWGDMDIAHDPAWDDVTVRELLSHTSGMPIARKSWLTLPGSCAIPLQQVMAAPPTPRRGTWVYSNGNYCALGLLIEHVTGEGRDRAAQQYVFDPLNISGPHLTSDGLLPGDGPYAEGVGRLDRLGGAGTWMASTDDLAAMMDAVTPADRVTLATPGIISDQYGWGHTGTVDGAKACVWVMEGGRTIVAGLVSGNKPSSGGDVCDELVPALAVDLDIWAGDPVRYPD